MKKVQRNGRLLIILYYRGVWSNDKQEKKNKIKPILRVLRVSAAAQKAARKVAKKKKKKKAYIHITLAKINPHILLISLHTSENLSTFKSDAKRIEISVCGRYCWPEMRFVVASNNMECKPNWVITVTRQSTHIHKANKVHKNNK